ncbi:hypothetical protein Tco_1180356 [Tanacetum coccineum]
MGPSFFLDKLSEVARSPSLGDKMKYVFGRSRSEDESLGSLMRNLCSALRVSMSTKRRLVAELEALGKVEGAAKSLEHMRAIVGRDAITLRELEALWARAQVGAALKAGFVTDMEVQESVDEDYRLGRQINRVAVVVHNVVSARLSSFGSLKVTGGVSEGDSAEGSGERGSNADFGEGNRVEC